MADITKLKTLMDLYGVGVRAGGITPQIEDEVYFRRVADLPEMSKDVVQDWGKTDNVRKPMTLAGVDTTIDTSSVGSNQDDEDNDDEDTEDE